MSRSIVRHSRCNRTCPTPLQTSPQLLFCRANHGDHYDREASRLVTQCLALDAPNEVRVEVWFYNFAHVPRMREESLRELRSLIYANVRSWGRDFSCNLVRVERDNQDAYDLVSALANVIAGHMEHATLPPVSLAGPRQNRWPLSPSAFGYLRF